MKRILYRSYGFYPKRKTIRTTVFFYLFEMSIHISNWCFPSIIITNDEINSECGFKYDLQMSDDRCCIGRYAYSFGHGQDP
jgi:hypothetical protein